MIKGLTQDFFPNRDRFHLHTADKPSGEAVEVLVNELMAVIFLQITILLSSIAALMKKKPVWILGIITGAFGIVYFFNGFLMLIK